VSGLAGRWHDVARWLEHEAGRTSDGEEAETLRRAAWLLRKRGDAEAEANEAERRKRVKDWDRRS
jgi:hypothetical protein